jgi:hypothetical protein
MTQQRTSGDTSPDRVANGDIVEQRWIPVSERLPVTPFGEWQCQGVRVLAWSKANGCDTAWFERDEEYKNRWKWECVSDPTHWMPLPKPPEVR